MNRPTPAHHGHGGMPPPPRHGLARYGSAPGSFLAALSEVARGGGADAPAPAQLHQHNHQQQQHAVSRFFSGESSGLTSCESTSRADVPPPLHRAYGGSSEIHVPPPALAPPQQQQPGLLRHSSSPAGLLSRLVGDPHAHGTRFSSYLPTFSCSPSTDRSRAFLCRTRSPSLVTLLSRAPPQLLVAFRFGPCASRVVVELLFGRAPPGPGGDRALRHPPRIC
jgi:hypothetical protein